MCDARSYPNPPPASPVAGHMLPTLQPTIPSTQEGSLPPCLHHTPQPALRARALPSKPLASSIRFADLVQWGLAAATQTTTTTKHCLTGGHHPAVLAMRSRSPHSRQEHIIVLDHTTTLSPDRCPLDQQLHIRFDEVAAPSPAPPSQVPTPPPPLPTRCTG